MSDWTPWHHSSFAPENRMLNPARSRNHYESNRDPISINRVRFYTEKHAHINRELQAECLHNLLCMLSVCEREEEEEGRESSLKKLSSL